MPNIHLPLAYLIGQGSVFVVLLLAKYSSRPEDAGVILIYVNLFSSMIQSAELGNSTYGVKILTKKRLPDFLSFLVGRLLVSVGFALILCYFFWTAQMNASPPSVAIVVGVLFGCAIYSLSFQGCLEYNGAFEKLSVLTTIPWLIISVGFYFGIVLDVVNIQILILIQLAWAIFLIYYSRRQFFFQRDNTLKLSSTIIFQTLVGLLSSGFAQFVARFFVLYASSFISAIELASLGIVRSVQTAGCVLVGLLLKPYLISISLSESTDYQVTESHYPSLKAKKHAKRILIVTYIVGIFIILALLRLEIPHLVDLLDWSPLLLCVPIWMLTLINLSICQLRMSSSKFLFLDVLSLIVCFITFVLVARFSVSWAFPLADLTRASLFAYAKNRGD